MGGRPHRRRRAHPARAAARAAEQIDRDRPIVFQCRSGSRSALATQVFREVRIRGIQPRRRPAGMGRIGPGDRPRRRRSSPAPAWTRAERSRVEGRPPADQPPGAPPPQPPPPPPRRGATPGCAAAQPGNHPPRRAAPRSRPPSRRPHSRSRLRFSGLRPRRPDRRPPGSGRRRGRSRRPAPGRRPSSRACGRGSAQLDRKLGLRTYVILAASLLALACSIVAVLLALDARDNAASADDVARLEQEIAADPGAPP